MTFEKKTIDFNSIFFNSSFHFLSPPPQKSRFDLLRETDSSRDDDSDDVYGCPGSTKTNINTSTRRRRFRRRRRIFARSIPTPCRSGAWEEDRQRRRPATTSRRRRTQTERTTQKRNRLNLPEEEEEEEEEEQGLLLILHRRNIQRRWIQSQSSTEIQSTSEALAKLVCF